jgi:uncharacterized membrane protein YkvI
MKLSLWGSYFLGEEIKNIVGVASIYAAAIIGAGFASGREIVQFFSIYHKGGFYGIVFAGCLFALFGCVVLDKVYRERIKNYDELIFPIMGWLPGRVMEISVTLFLLSVFCVMLAGSGSIISEKLGIPFKYAIVLSSFVFMVLILTNIKGIVTISTVITPVMTAGMIIIGFYIILARDTAVFLNITGYIKHVSENWFFSALLYVGYNSILSAVVLCRLLPYLRTRQTGIAGGMLGAAVLGIVALVINHCIYLFSPGSLSEELPVTNIIERYSRVLDIIYSLILWFAMMVSAVTTGFSFIDRISSKIKADRKIITVVACAVVTPLSGFGFSKLVSTIYPLFGYIGLFMVFVILFDGFKGLYLKRHSEQK